MKKIRMHSYELLFPLVLSFVWNRASSYSTGDLGKSHIAGIWRLKNEDSTSLSKWHIPIVHKNRKKVCPLKEFTVYPKPQNEQRQQMDEEEDVLLLLREDGKFSQYHNFPSASPNDNKPSGNVYINEDKGEGDGIKGTWAFVDGNLILAADTPPTIEKTNERGSSNNVNNIMTKEPDTILVGRVVAKSEDRLIDNPALLRKDNNIANNGNNINNLNNISTSSAIKEEETGQEDVHLSVPTGKVQIGKFFYPRQHPSFFEQPMFQPKTNGTFELRQILGTLNTKLDEEVFVEKFRKKDLVDKRFIITSFPLSNQRKRKQRWSIKYNKYVDKIPKTEKEKNLEKMEKNSPVPIKAFEVDLFANNTFSTVTGLGDMVLRGKWWIIGEKRDQLWMQVWRFGFGRSVSGSTFSEGMTLSEKDEVTYWGKIYRVDGSKKEDSLDSDALQGKGMGVEINGSVMSGYGLEPCFTDRFTMIEETENDMDCNDHSDEDDDGDGGDDDDGTFDDLPELGQDIGIFE